MFSLALCIANSGGVVQQKTYMSPEYGREIHLPVGGNNLPSTQTFQANVMGISKILHILVSGVHTHRDTPQLIHTNNLP